MRLGGPLYPLHVEDVAFVVGSHQRPDVDPVVLVGAEQGGVGIEALGAREGQGIGSSGAHVLIGAGLVVDQWRIRVVAMLGAEGLGEVVGRVVRLREVGVSRRDPDAVRDRLTAVVHHAAAGLREAAEDGGLRRPVVERRGDGVQDAAGRRRVDPAPEVDAGRQGADPRVYA